MQQTRRQFLQNALYLGAFSAVSTLPVKTFAKIMKTASFNPVTDAISPIARIASLAGTKTILGDTHDEAHNIFWDKEGFLAKKGGIPKAHKHYDVVIVGSGMAGLAAALKLPGKSILILDGHPRVGGNAKAEVAGNTFLGMGSAYCVIPEEGDEFDQFFEEIGVKPYFRKVAYETSDLCFKDRIVSDFWKGATDPERAHEFIRVHDRLWEIYNNEYPDVPTYEEGNSEARQYFDKLDKLSFEEWIKAEFGSVHPHIEEYFHQYAWSSFCMSYDYISAAQMLNFITADMAGIQALPGGNAAIAQAMYEILKARGNVSFKNVAFAVDVREKGSRTEVCYHKDNKVLETVSGDSCVVTIPKMVAKHVVHGLSKTQYEAMHEIDYRAYLVANVILKNKRKPHDYDLYCLTGEVPRSEYKDSTKRVYTDMIFADWANEEEATGSALTLYIPIPYSMGQQYLFIDTLYDKYVGRIQKRIEPFLKNQGMSLNDIGGIRLTRYGHAVPASVKNGMASKMYEKACASINDKIHFAGQDNWGNPSIEAALYSGVIAAGKINGEI